METLSGGQRVVPVEHPDERNGEETMNSDEYVNAADKYCALILSNTKDADWTLRYFTAQIYLDLYHYI